MTPEHYERFAADFDFLRKSVASIAERYGYELSSFEVFRDGVEFVSITATMFVPVEVLLDPSKWDEFLRSGPGERQ